MPRKSPPKNLNENPDWTAADFAKAKKHPGGISLKDLGAETARGRGRPKSENPKEAVKLRLDADVVESYRSTGDGWQTRINADLRKARKLKAG